jgi:hypothetical protein
MVMKQHGVNLRTLANMDFEIDIFSDITSEHAEGRSINPNLQKE